MGELTRRSFVSATVAAVFYGGAAAAQNVTPSAATRVALKGYDPVSYFTDGKPEQGLERIQLCLRRHHLLVQERRAPRQIRGRPRALRAAVRRLLRGAALARPQGGGRSGGLDHHQWQTLRLFRERRVQKFNEHPVDIAQKAAENLKQLR